MASERNEPTDAVSAVRREHELGEQGSARTERQRDIAPNQGGGRERIWWNCNWIMSCIIQ